MGHHGRVAVGSRQLDGLEGLGEGSNLVDLHQDGICDPAVDSPLEPLGVCDEQVVANQLDAVADRLGEGDPAVPVVFGHAVLY